MDKIDYSNFLCLISCFFGIKSISLSVCTSTLCNGLMDIIWSKSQISFLGDSIVVVIMRKKALSWVVLAMRRHILKSVKQQFCIGRICASDLIFWLKLDGYSLKSTINFWWNTRLKLIYSHKWSYIGNFCGWNNQLSHKGLPLPEEGALVYRGAWNSGQMSEAIIIMNTILSLLSTRKNSSCKN